MKLRPTSPSPRRAPQARCGQRGSAVLLVLAFVFILELLILSNTRTLDHLKHELTLLEQKQQEKFAPAGAPKTNQAPARPLPPTRRP